MSRLWRHLTTTRWRLHRCFPPSALAAIERAIASTERQHSGEIRFAIESALNLRRLRAHMDPRTRAHELYASLRVWDTQANNGVLIYLLLAERDIEIVADRGYAGQVSAEEWGAVCREMETAFGSGHYEAGALAGIERVAALIARHFPPRPGDRNELPDAPVIVG
jgi:uncharacterized membrane protein